MERYALQWTYKIASNSDDSTVTGYIADVMHELVNLTECRSDLHDPAVALDLADRSVDIELVVEADDPGEAVQIGLSCIRSAIHAAGGYTGTWDLGSVTAKPLVTVNPA